MELADLYPAMDSAALSRDIERARRRRAFETLYRRASWPRRPARRPASEKLGGGAREYEALEELIGRIASYAGLIYAGDTSDPEARQILRRRPGEDDGRQRALLFFALELNRIDDALIARPWTDDPGFAPLPPWVLDISARTSPTSSTTASSSCSTRSRSRARRLEPPVRRDHDGLRFDVDGES
jgi:oligoendopeptidase F